MSLLSTLLLNDAPVRSSVDTLQCSADGQIAVVTRSVVYIVTPNFDSTPEGKSGSKEANSSNGALAWFKTVVHDVEKARAWSEHSEEWRTISLGSLEPAWQAATWSPSGLNKLGGCLLVTLTNNMEVFVWAPAKNPLVGEWIKTQNITEGQVSAYDQENLMFVEDVLRCQTSSISWSSSRWESNLDFPPVANGSLLALGNRFGDVNFFHWDSDMYTARHCLTCHVANAWVTNLAWSEWKLANAANSDQIAQAYLACGLSDGSVWTLVIEHNPSLEEPYSVFKLPQIIEADARSITAVTFAATRGDRQLLLAVGKPGFVCLYSQSGLSVNRAPEGTSLQMVLLSATRTSLASTSIATCTGLYYLSPEDRLVVVLAEGSLNVIADASGMAHLEENNDEPDQTTAFNGSKVLKRITEAAEECSFNQAEYARIYGLRALGSGRHVVWTQMVLQPYDLSFRVQANFRTRVCIAKLWDQETDTNSRITALVNTVQREPRSIACYSPTALLREVMLETLDPNTIISLAPRLLPLLAPNWELTASDEAPTIDPAAMAISSRFIYRTRLKFSLTLFILNRPSLPNDLVALFRALHDKLLELLMALHIYEKVDKVLVDGSNSMLDAVAILRLMHAAQYCPVPDSVASRFSQLRSKVQEYAQQHTPGQQLLGGTNPRPILELLWSVDIGETCPACDSVVLFQNLTYGRCQAGHVWERCSTSLQLICGIGSLTCTGCGRKSLDTDPRTLTYPGTHCVLCGHRYSRVL